MNLNDDFGGCDWQVDSTGVGDPIVDDLERDGLRVTGYQFGGNRKAILVEALMMDMENGSISFPDWPVLFREFEVFEGERLPSGVWRYSAPEGETDDVVMGLALWNWARRLAVHGSHTGLFRYLRAVKEPDEPEGKDDDGIPQTA